jgi:hypothetical protein
VETGLGSSTGDGALALQDADISTAEGYNRGRNRTSWNTKRISWSDGMNTSVVSPPQARARSIEFLADAFVVHLEDGRSLTVPLEWFPRLRVDCPTDRQS